MANPYFNATYYLLNNLDVAAAGYTVQNAEEHYLQYGAAEALASANSTRKPAPWFDAAFYVTSNPDLLAAGLSATELFEHFTTYGIGEGRTPSVAAVVTPANLLAYAKGNADLLEAFGIDASATALTAEQEASLAKHFYQFGYQENRPAAPFSSDQPAPNQGQTFHLTPGLDFADVSGAIRNGSNFPEFKFTDKNETVIAPASSFLTSNGVPAVLVSLLDGTTTDNDVLQLTLDATSPAATIRNIETFNVTATNTAAANLDLTNVTGLKTLNIAGTPTAAVTVVGVTTTTGVTTVDASKLTTNQAFNFVANAATTADMTITGAAVGINTITGGLGNDVITGGAGNDVLTGGAGNDTINGGAGNDTIVGGSGNNVIDGGAGNDTISVTTGNNTINGGAGNDTITGGNGNNTVDTGAGTDSVTLGNGNNKVTGGAGVDTVIVGNGNNVIDTGAGNDVITVGTGNNTITGGAGDDTITLGAGANTLVLGGTFADNGLDGVTGFTAGAATAATRDVLNVSSFLGSISNFTSIDIAATNNTEGSNLVVLNGAFNAANVGTTLLLSKSANIVVVEDDGTDSTVRYITTDANGAIVTNDAVVTLVAVAAAETLVEVNFA